MSFSSISDQCTSFIPRENVRKPEVFLTISGVWNIGMKWFSKTNCIPKFQSFSVILNEKVEIWNDEVLLLVLGNSSQKLNHFVKPCSKINKFIFIYFTIKEQSFD